MEKPRRTWMPASWKFLPKPQRLRVNRKRLNVLVKAKIWHKANDKLVGRCEGRWMDVEEMSPIWCELHGVKKSQGSFFFLVWGLFIVDGGGCSPVSQGLINGGKPWNPLFVRASFQTHFTHFTRWFQSLRFPRDDSIWRADCWFFGWNFKDSIHRWLVVLEDFGESQRCIREAKDWKN